MDVMEYDYAVRHDECDGYREVWTERHELMQGSKQSPENNIHNKYNNVNVENNHTPKKSKMNDAK